MCAAINKQELIRNILDIEWDMFRRVKSSVPAPCQLQQESFRRIRESVYETWTDEALQACHLDFEKAQRAGRNLCTEKYAQMEGRISRARVNPLIEHIVVIETRWQDEIRRNYPALYRRVCRSTSSFHDGRSFSIYLASEIQTYSDRTIELYYRGMKDALEKGENLALKSLELLVKKGGYSDVAHAEEHLSKAER
jgi:hypothetical protein